MKNKSSDSYKVNFFIWFSLYLLFTIACLVAAWYAPSYFWRVVTLAGFIIGTLLVWGITAAWKLFKEVLDEIDKGY